MSSPKAIKLQLSLKGRPIREFTFDQDLITLGRDPESDVLLDNPGISRKHASIMRTPGGYYAVQDMNSSNGTFINGKRIEREYLTASDQLSLGKFLLVVDYAEERRAAVGAEEADAPAPSYTTMMSKEKFSRLIEQREQKERSKPDLKLVPPPAKRVEIKHWWMNAEVWAAFAFGLLMGLLLSRWV